MEYVPEVDHSTPHLGDTQQCPECHASVPVSRGYVAWCDHCGWNVQPYDPNPPRNIFEAKYAQLGKKFSRQLLDRMRDEKNLRPVLTPSLVAAFAIAALVHLVTIALALTGIVLLFAGNCVLFAIGIIFLGMVWVLRPRFHKVPKGGIASREEFPTLYRISDQVAEAIGAPTVNMIRLGGQFNASFSQPGFPRKRVMYLGLPLFSILDAQEWVALLGHELGHCVNGDVSRTLVVGMAIDSLVGWYKLFYPGRIWDRRGSDGVRVGGLVGLVAIPANLLMLGLAQVARFWINTLVNLLWSNSQRAEYLADALGARAAGTDAAVSALDKLHLSDSIRSTVHRVALNTKAGTDLFVEFRRSTGDVPERERERIRRRQLLASSRMDSTHPPTPYRLDLLKAHPVAQPAVVLSEADFEEIQRELRRVSPGIQAAIMDSHLASIAY